MTQMEVSTSTCTSSASQAEYIIYAYNHFEPEKLGQNRWQRISTLSKSEQAVIKAEKLYESELYQKVEIKKKKFDEKKGCYISSTLRVYQQKPALDAMKIASFVLILLAGAGYFFWL